MKTVIIAPYFEIAKRQVTKKKKTHFVICFVWLWNALCLRKRTYISSV